MTINTDKAAIYGLAIAALKKDGKLSPDTQHQQVRYFNNPLEADHYQAQALDLFHSWLPISRTALATIKGFGMMRAQEGSRIPLSLLARRRRQGELGTTALRSRLVGHKLTSWPRLPVIKVCNGAAWAKFFTAAPQRR